MTGIEKLVTKTNNAHSGLGDSVGTAPASSGPDAQSSAGSPLSGLRLLSAAASSSGSGTQDHDPASMTIFLRSMLVGCERANGSPGSTWP
ncbi:unnamed protein product [Phytophthora fragariaefolia]|uniref:Unnamed protein product n=1 Tax=Phytophthora fragariaefolia TaxID=1490495 RepID=A0A9W6WKL6_9STRA|nr:unnamed protein product [Phytophthora fragariaefolia]